MSSPRSKHPAKPARHARLITPAMLAMTYYARKQMPFCEPRIVYQYAPPEVPLEHPHPEPVSSPIQVEPEAVEGHDSFELSSFPPAMNIIPRGRVPGIIYANGRVMVV